MPEVVTVGAAWAVPAALLLGMVAVVAASADAVLVARRDGVDVRAGAIAPLAETARLLRQRRRVTPAADGPLWRVGRGGLLVAALLMVAVVPWGSWVPADLPVGVVWFNAVDVTVWAFVWLAGWGPNAAFSLVGAYRFLAQALAYELPLMFALTAPALAAGSLRVADVAAAQQGLWFALWMPVAFAVYCLGVLGFAVWGPLAPPMGGDIAGGVLAEVSGPDRLLLLAGRYALLAAGAVFAVPLFLGGGAGPLLPGWLWVLVKALVLVVALIAVGRRLPTLRPDRFLELGWMVLLPAVLLQVLVVALVVVL
jgi:NADH-quinone oxidoreductase subunit H